MTEEDILMCRLKDIPVFGFEREYRDDEYGKSFPFLRKRWNVWLNVPFKNSPIATVVDMGNYYLIYNSNDGEEFTKTKSIECYTDVDVHNALLEIEKSYE